MDKRLKHIRARKVKVSVDGKACDRTRRETIDAIDVHPPAWSCVLPRKDSRDEECNENTSHSLNQTQ